MDCETGSAGHFIIIEIVLGLSVVHIEIIVTDR